ncbi:MAG: hypothetical protein ACQESP_06860 [Candidatus Muiribacteriota bacterium]
MVNFFIIFFIIWLLAGIFQDKIKNAFNIKTRSYKDIFASSTDEDEDIETETTGVDEDGNVIVELKKNKKNKPNYNLWIIWGIILAVLFLPVFLRLALFFLRLAISFLPFIILFFVFREPITKFVKELFK